MYEAGMSISWDNLRKAGLLYFRGSKYPIPNVNDHSEATKVGEQMARSMGWTGHS